MVVINHYITLLICLSLWLTFLLVTGVSLSVCVVCSDGQFLAILQENSVEVRYELSRQCLSDILAV